MIGEAFLVFSRLSGSGEVIPDDDEEEDEQDEPIRGVRAYFLQSEGQFKFVYSK